MHQKEQLILDLEHKKRYWRNRVKNDPHALGKWRVDGALPHIDAWYEAFGIIDRCLSFRHVFFAKCILNRHSILLPCPLSVYQPYHTVIESFAFGKRPFRFQKGGLE